MHPLRSIRSRLTVTFTLGIAVLLIAANLVLMSYAYHGASVRADHQLGEATERIKSALADEIDEAGEEARSSSRGDRAKIMAATLRDTRGFLAEEQVSAAIRDDWGTEWATYSGSPDYRVRARGAFDPASLAQRGFHSRLTRFRLGDNGSQLTALVFLSWNRPVAALRNQAALLSALSLFVILVTAAGTWFLVGRTLRPIDLLVQQVSRYSGQKAIPQSLRLASPSGDAEVVRLVTTVNELLAGIAENTAARGRFYAAASHELRTPLHVLAGQAELTLSRPRDADSYRAALETVQRQADRLIALSESLLLLNRLDRGVRETLPVDTTDLVALCRESLTGQELLVRKNCLSIQMEFAELTELVNAPQAHVEILVRNLIENAVRYAAANGEVNISIRKQSPPLGSDSPVVLEIYNDAPPLSSEDAARLLEPFFRPDASRTLQTGGNGLGLSICKALAEANGWRFALTPERGGFRATVTFNDVSGGIGE